LRFPFKRIRKILEKANVAPGDAHQVSPDLFEHAAERELHAAVRGALQKCKPETGGKYQEALETIAGLRKRSIISLTPSW